MVAQPHSLKPNSKRLNKLILSIPLWHSCMLVQRTTKLSIHVYLVFIWLDLSATFETLVFSLFAILPLVHHFHKSTLSNVLLPLSAVQPAVFPSRTDSFLTYWPRPFSLYVLFPSEVVQAHSTNFHPHIDYLFWFMFLFHSFCLLLCKIMSPVQHVLIFLSPLLVPPQERTDYLSAPNLEENKPWIID